MTNFLITGGAGFIGSAVCRRLSRETHNQVICLDALKYSGNEASLSTIADRSNFAFVKGDIRDTELTSQLLRDHSIDVVMNLAAESHVDRSIDAPTAFIDTNVVGTFRLLDSARSYFNDQKEDKKSNFRFHHISTDEVFGDLPFDKSLFTEKTAYSPTSPYSASKAASDHLARAWYHTYGLPVVLSNCSNNYGPYQFPEKLIPLIILNALDERTLPVYGKGENVRDWLHVDDHAEALEAVATKGRVGESYNIGGNAERQNMDVVKTICEALDERHPRANGASYSALIETVADRPGHDRRYAIDSSKIRRELKWAPKRSFEDGLRDTIEWYLTNEAWWFPLRQIDKGIRRGLVGQS